MSSPIRLSLRGYEPDANEPEVDTIITIAGRPPRFDEIAQAKWFVIGQRYYKEQARALFDTLAASLPGGVMHHLTVLMLEHRTNLLRTKE